MARPDVKQSVVISQVNGTKNCLNDNVMSIMLFFIT